MSTKNDLLKVRETTPEPWVETRGAGFTENCPIALRPDMTGVLTSSFHVNCDITAIASAHKLCVSLTTFHEPGPSLHDWPSDLTPLVISLEGDRHGIRQPYPRLSG